MGGSGALNGAANTEVLIPTLLQISNDELRYWTSLTCIYDPHWEPVSGKVTLPVCMFNVTDIKQTFSTEVSKKRVILYEPQGEDKLTAKEMSNGMRENVMQTITDNAVKQPAVYAVEAVVPFQPVGRYVADGVKHITDLVSGIAEIYGGKEFASVWDQIFGAVGDVFKLAQSASNFAGQFAKMEGASYINMNSLEAMAESCRTVCMKMWTGYDYKYGIITGLTYHKKPLEDDVYRASFTLQEMPVLAITRPESPGQHIINRNWAVTAITAVQGALIAPLTALTGVKAAS